jgi:hypothetical protein
MNHVYAGQDIIRPTAALQRIHIPQSRQGLYATGTALILTSYSYIVVRTCCSSAVPRSHDSLTVRDYMQLLLDLEI